MPDRSTKLTVYQWTALNNKGQKRSGEIRARSITIAKAELKKQGLKLSKISPKRKTFFKRRPKKIQPQDIAVFSRQMATMMEAGIPLIQSFDIVAKGQSNKKMSQLIFDIKQNVESGMTFAESLKKHPKYFNELYCNLVEAGEQSGALEMMLDNVASYREKIESIKKKIKKALFYPISVMVIAFLVSAGLLIFVVPQFESLFEGFGADLPTLTRIVIDMSEFLQAYWYYIFGILCTSIVLFIHAYRKSPRLIYTVDKLSLKLPIIGAILKKAAIARFARTLSITFAAGMPLVDALRSVAGATGNILFSDATFQIRDDVSSGIQMQSAMDSTKMFPNMVIQMVAIGEESGALEHMLAKVADFYEEDVDNAVDALSSLLEPLIMAILGTMVGGLVIAMYLPIFKLGAVV